MTITYQETVYQCRCDCGQTLYVSAGHCLRNYVRQPHQLSAQCPACLQAAWLTYRPTKHIPDPPVYVGHIPPSRKPARARILYADMAYLEKSIELYKRRYEVASKNLASLEGVVQQALRAWREHWRMAVMPHQFREILRVLREQLPPP